VTLPVDYRFKEPLLKEIAEFIDEGQEDPERLTDLATRLARLHHKRIQIYRRLAELRDWTPDMEGDIAAIPAVPTEAFKRTSMNITPPQKCTVFSTSGTSKGEDNRGRAYYSPDDMVLMDLAIDVNARRYLFPDYPEVKTKLLVLAPSPEMAPQMVMTYGMNRLCKNFGLPGSGFMFGPQGLDVKRLFSELEKCCMNDVPVTIVGASFGFVHLFEAFRKNKTVFELPRGSRAMDAGGFKGRSREIGREELVKSFGELFGVERDRCVNLLGLTEHASQYYDDPLAALQEKRPAREGKQNPPWTRTWVVHPETLQSLDYGDTGLLLHLDLANGGHPFMVLTDDLGLANEQGFRVLGRAGGSESRGCSLTVDELMSSKGKGA
jgi:Acyl-protein synthetase, LuxE